MVRQVTSWILCIGLSCALGCKQPEPGRPIEPVARTLATEPVRCTRTGTYTICRYADGVEHITVFEGDKDLVHVHVPGWAAPGTAVVPYDACECRIIGCKPMCTTTTHPPYPGPMPDAGVPDASSP